MIVRRVTKEEIQLALNMLMQVMGIKEDKVKLHHVTGHGYIVKELDIWTWNLMFGSKYRSAREMRDTLLFAHDVIKRMQTDKEA